jgi:serine protease Do
MTWRWRTALLGLLVLCSSLVLGWVGGAAHSAMRAPRQQSTPQQDSRAAASNPPESSQAREVGQEFVGIAERLAPSVVRVTTRQHAAPLAKLPRQSPNPFEGTPFERFFRDFRQGFPEESPGPRTGMGSGVVIDNRGHILTNDHVVADADEVRVTFVDGRELKAKTVGADPKTDLAVIAVEGATPRAAEFGDSDQMHVGEWVMAIGNPFGLDHSVTVGVLSAKGRYGFAAGKLEDFLQTDASINPGNSGGPLVNLRGQVVGINAMIAGLGTGVGFAVSEAIARPIARQLIERGKVIRPYIGIVMQPLTPDLRQAMAPNGPEKGALVAEVQKASPAEKAGIHAGDIVVSVAGKATNESRDVQRTVLDQQVGAKVPLTIWRNGKKLEMSVKTEELPPDSDAPVGKSDREGNLGLELQTLTPEIAERLDLDRSVRGVVIAAVREGSVAAEAGLRVGDVIVSVDQVNVESAEAAAGRLSQKRTEGHLVRVRRQGGSLFIVLPNARAEN